MQSFWMGTVRRQVIPASQKYKASSSSDDSIGSLSVSTWAALHTSGIWIMPAGHRHTHTHFVAFKDYAVLRVKLQDQFLLAERAQQ